MNPMTTEPQTALRRSPGQDRSRARVNEILDAAFELIGRHGADNVTISDIAEHAGLSGPSVYRYFPSKQAIVTELAVREFETVRAARLERLHAFSGDLRPVLLDGLRSYIHQHQTEPAKAQLRAAVRADPELASLDLDDTRQNAAMFAAALRTAEGTDHPDLERRLLLVYELLDGVIHLVCRIPPTESAPIIDDFVALAEHHLFGASES